MKKKERTGQHSVRSGGKVNERKHTEKEYFFPVNILGFGAWRCFYFLYNRPRNQSIGLEWAPAKHTSVMKRE